MKWLIPMMVMFSIPAFSTVTVGNKCPTEFEGVIKEIVPSVGPSQPFAIQKVIFETTDGSEEEQMQVDVLQNGGFDLERGKEYHVEIRDGRLCRIEQI
jgi:hypothetical protein